MSSIWLWIPLALAAGYLALRLWLQRKFPGDGPRPRSSATCLAALLALGMAAVLALLFALRG